MVNYIADLDLIFSALSDGTRRAILSRLAEGEATVTELAAPFEMSLPAVSKHLKVLERAGLLARTVDGRVHRLKLQPERLRTASEWVDHSRRFWEDQMDRLAAFLEPPGGPPAGRDDQRDSPDGRDRRDEH